MKHNLNNLTHEELLGHMAWLRSFAAALVRDPNEADDLVQDAFQVLATTRDRVGNVRGFLASTVRFLSMKAKRSEVRRKGREERVAQARSLEGEPPQDTVERMDIMRAVLEEIRELPAAQARVLGMRYLDGSETSEIAKREGVAPQTVRAHLSRGLQSLRERLDRRFGSREMWSAVLVPWALPVPIGGAPLVDESQIPLSASEAGGTATTGTTSAFLSSGVILVTLKVSALVAVPAACIAIWAANQPSAAPQEFTDGESPLVTADTELVSLDRSTPKTRNLAGAVPPPEESVQEEKLVPLEENATATAGQFPFAGRIVDKWTGEPIPNVGLSLTVYEQDGSGKTFVGHTLAKADGTFASDKFAASSNKAVVLIRDKATEEAFDFLPDYRGPFPFEGDLAVEVGPTFSLVYESGSFDPTAEYRVEAPGKGMRSLPQMTVVRTDPAPWVRFARPLDKRGAKGPWTIRVVDQEGFLSGTGKIKASFGIQVEPVKIDFVEQGAIAFELAKSDGIIPRFLDLHLQGPNESESTQIFLRKSESALTAEARWLEPGTYRWTMSFGEESQSGEVQVVPNQWSKVDLAAFAIKYQRVHVLFDATEFPELDLAAFQYIVFNEGHPKDQVWVAPKRMVGGQKGMWEIDHGGFPAGEWMLAIQVEGGYEVENPMSKILFGGEPMQIKVQGRSMTEVTLSVVDAATGQPIPNAVAMHMVGMQSSRLEADASGGFKSIEIPMSRDTSFFVSAPGYRLTEQLVKKTHASAEVSIALQKGWRSRVLVIDMTRQAPLANVEVTIDGKPVGRTSSDGSLWFEGEGPPKLIEVALGDETLEVIHSPFSEEGIGPYSEFGFPFVVQPRTN